MNRISKQSLERVARIYKSNKEASQALGLHPRSFSRLCREHNILTPYVRLRNNRQASVHD
jgi:hypothetical protein